MPSDYAVDLVFEGFQSATRGSGKAFGWKERYYGQFDSIDAALRAPTQDIQGANTTLTLIRRSFLAENWRISYIVATDLRNPRATKVTGPTGLLGASRSILNPAQVQCAAAATLYRLPRGADTQIHRRNIALRGLNSLMVNGNILRTDSTDFQGLVAFLNLIGYRDGAFNSPPPGPSTNRWLIGYQDVTLLGQAITALTLSPTDPHYVLLTSAGLGNVIRGDRIIVQGIVNLRGVNKTWRVVQDTLAGQPILLGRSKTALDVGADAITAAGRARKKRLTVNPADQYVIRGVTLRKTGRPINPLRGRASVRPA